MLDSIRPLHEQLTLGTDLMRNCVRDLSEEDAVRRPEGGANHIAFLVAHLADARYFLAGYLGAPRETRLAALKDINSIDQLEGELPSLEDLLEIWDEISEHLAMTVENLRPESIDAPSEARFPVRDGAIRGGLTFLMHHEAYHIGQIGMIRRQLGLPAMTFDRPEPPGSD